MKGEIWRRVSILPKAAEKSGKMNEGYKASVVGNQGTLLDMFQEQSQ